MTKTPFMASFRTAKYGRLGCSKPVRCASTANRFDINRLDELFGALTYVLETCKRIYNL